MHHPTSPFPFSSHSVFPKRVTLFCFVIQFKCSGFYIPSLYMYICIYIYIYKYVHTHILIYACVFIFNYVSMYRIIYVKLFLKLSWVNFKYHGPLPLKYFSGYFLKIEIFSYITTAHTFTVHKFIIL